MSVSSTIFLFLLVGSQFTYVYHFSINNGLTAFNGEIVWNLTWKGNMFNATGTVNYTFINASGVKHYSYNITESEAQYLHDWYSLTTIFFPNFVVNSYSWGYYNSSIPSITLMMNKNSYIVISAQYGIPLAGKWTGTNLQGFNESYNFTLVKNSLPLAKVSYNVYMLNVTSTIAFTIMSPHIAKAQQASYSVKALNGTITLPGLTVVSKGFLTMVLPSYEVSELGGIAVMFYNGSKYFVGLSSNSVQYMNESNPFLITILGHYVFMFFPYGGNVTLIFYNPNLHEKISLTTLPQGNENLFRYLILGVIVAIALVFGTVLALRARRPS